MSADDKDGAAAGTAAENEPNKYWPQTEDEIIDDVFGEPSWTGAESGWKEADCTVQETSDPYHSGPEYDDDELDNWKVGESENIVDVESTSEKDKNENHLNSDYKSNDGLFESDILSSDQSECDPNENCWSESENSLKPDEAEQQILEPVTECNEKDEQSGLRATVPVFSRSAETTRTGAEYKQSLQRSTRLHARRPLVGRRGVTKGDQCNAKGRIRVSKSCTTECEILKPDLAKNYPCPDMARYASLYEEILRSEEFLVFSDEDDDGSSDFDDDGPNSESTALEMDNENSDSKSELSNNRASGFSELVTNTESPDLQTQGLRDGAVPGTSDKAKDLSSVLLSTSRVSDDDTVSKNQITTEAHPTTTGSDNVAARASRRLVDSDSKLLSKSESGSSLTPASTKTSSPGTEIPTKDTVRPDEPALDKSYVNDEALEADLNCDKKVFTEPKNATTTLAAASVSTASHDSAAVGALSRVLEDIYCHRSDQLNKVSPLWRLKSAQGKQESLTNDPRTAPPVLSILGLTPADQKLSKYPRYDHNDVCFDLPYQNALVDPLTGMRTKPDAGHLSTDVTQGISNSTKCGDESGRHCTVAVDIFMNEPTSENDLDENGDQWLNGISPLSEKVGISTSEALTEASKNESTYNEKTNTSHEFDITVKVEPAIDGVESRGPVEGTDAQSNDALQSIVKHPVSPIVKQYYMSFLNVLRNKKLVNKKVRRPPQKFFKALQTKNEFRDGEKGAGVSNREVNMLLEKHKPSKNFPKGREVPPGWKPGQGSAKTIAQISAAYNEHNPKRKCRKINSGKARAMSKGCNNNKKKLHVPSECSIPDIESDMFLPRNRKTSFGSDATDSADSKNTVGYGERYNPDSDGSSGDERLVAKAALKDVKAGDFESKRKYYEQLHGVKATKSEKVARSMDKLELTSQVKFLKTIDDYCNAEDFEHIEYDSYEGSVSGDYCERSMSYVEYHKSLVQYYTKRASNIQLMSCHPPREPRNSASGIRIRRASHNVPSAIDSERLKCLGIDENNKNVGMWSLNTLYAHKRGICEVPKESSNQMFPSGGDGREEALAANNILHQKAPPKARISKRRARGKYRNLRRGKPTARKATPMEALSIYESERKITYLDLLKSGYCMKMNRPGKDLGNSDAQPAKQDDVVAHKSKSCDASANKCQPVSGAWQREISPNKEAESPRRKLKLVRFNEPKPMENEKGTDPLLDRSEEDTWCYSVNAMLLRANKVMEKQNQGTKNDYHFPRPESAKVVAPVVKPMSSSFLSELLEQDRVEQIRVREKHKLAVKIERPIPGKPVIKVSEDSSPKSESNRNSTLSDNSDKPSDTSSSDVVNSFPIIDHKSQSAQKVSAGILKIKSSLSKKAEERALRVQQRLSEGDRRAALYMNPAQPNILPKKLLPLRYSAPTDAISQIGSDWTPVRIIKESITNKYASDRFYSRREAAMNSGHSSYRSEKSSEALLGYKYTRMDHRASSIVQMFSDSNNNANRSPSDSESSDYENHLVDPLELPFTFNPRDAITEDKGGRYRSFSGRNLHRISEDAEYGSFVLHTSTEEERSARLKQTQDLSSDNVYERSSSTTSPFTPIKPKESTVVSSGVSLTDALAPLKYGAQNDPDAFCMKSVVDMLGQGKRSKRLPATTCASNHEFTSEGLDGCESESTLDCVVGDSDSESFDRRSFLRTLLGYQDTDSKGAPNGSPKDLNNEENQTGVIAMANIITPKPDMWYPGAVDQITAPLPMEVKQNDEPVNGRVCEQGDQRLVDSRDVRLVQFNALPELLRTEKKCTETPSDPEFISSALSRLVVQGQSVPLKKKCSLDSALAATRREENVSGRLEKPQTQLSPSAHSFQWSCSDERNLRDQNQVHVTQEAAPNNDILTPPRISSGKKISSLDEAQKTSPAYTQEVRRQRYLKKDSQAAMENSAMTVLNYQEHTKEKNKDSKPPIYRPSAQNDHHFDEVFKNFEHEQWKCTESCGRFFNWEKIKLPPPFPTGNINLAESPVRSASWVEVFRSVSRQSGYSTPSDEAVPEKGSQQSTEESHDTRIIHAVQEDNTALNVEGANVVNSPAYMSADLENTNTDSRTEENHANRDELLVHATNMIQVEMGDDLVGELDPKDNQMLEVFIDGQRAGTSNLLLINPSCIFYKTPQYINPTAKYRCPDRQFLKMLRGTDLLQAVGLDKQRLLSCLQSVTRSRTYIPSFYIRSLNPVEITPAVVELHKCADVVPCFDNSVNIQTFPVFYTHSSGRLIQRVFTVNYIAQGLYSMENSEPESPRSRENMSDPSEIIKAAKLIQYLPGVASLALVSKNLYLFADQYTSYDEALQFLTKIHDLVMGQTIAKYFEIMCGWVPVCFRDKATTLCSKCQSMEDVREKATVRFHIDNPPPSSTGGDGLKQPAIYCHHCGDSMRFEYEGDHEMTVLMKTRWDINCDGLAIPVCTKPNSKKKVSMLPGIRQHKVTCVRSQHSDRDLQHRRSFSLPAISKCKIPPSKAKVSMPAPSHSSPSMYNQDWWWKEVEYLRHKEMEDFKKEYFLQQEQIQQEEDERLELQRLQHQQRLREIKQELQLQQSGLGSQGENETAHTKPGMATPNHTVLTTPNLSDPSTPSRQVGSTPRGGRTPSVTKQKSDEIECMPPYVMRMGAKSTMNWVKKYVESPAQISNVGGYTEKKLTGRSIIPPPFSFKEQKPVPIRRTNQVLKKKIDQLLTGTTNSKIRQQIAPLSVPRIGAIAKNKSVKMCKSKSSVSTDATSSASDSESSSSGTSSSETESSSDASEYSSHSDFFTSYAKRGGPTSIQDIFTRTLPRMKLPSKLEKVKQAMEREKLMGQNLMKLLPQMPGEDGDGEPAYQDQPDLAFAHDYDMCEDADEMRELWKLCFPEVNFWTRKKPKRTDALLLKNITLTNAA